MSASVAPPGPGLAADRLAVLSPAEPSPLTVVGYLRLVGNGWKFQLRLRSRSAFDGALSVVWPLFFASTAYLMVRAGSNGAQTLAATAVGSSVMGVWSAVTTVAASSLQQERRQGTLELLVAAPAPFPIVVLPLALSMATIGGYSLVATLLWARFVFHVQLSFVHPFLLLAVLPLTVVSVGALGFVLVVSAARYRSAWALGNAVEYPVWLIAGFLVPLSVLPGWVHPISWALAPTWAVEALRDTMLGGPGVVVDLLACAGLAAGYILLGSVLSRFLLRSARERATLALT